MRDHAEVNAGYAGGSASFRANNGANGVNGANSANHPGISAGEKAIVVENLVHDYDGIRALDGVSLEIERGEKVAILGPNGSGKTTLMLCICNLIRPKSGRIRVMGVEVNGKNEDRIRKLVGIVFQNPDDQVFSATVFDDVAFGLRNMGLDEDEVERRVRAILKTMRIEHLAERNPANLSGGEKKKVAIAGVIAMNPPVILIDEPTAGLDHPGIHEIYNILCELNANGLTIVVTTHDSEFAFAWADRIVVMSKGKVVSENFREFTENPAVRIRLPGKERAFQEMRELGILNPGVFEHLKGMGLRGKVRVVEGKADYCYGMVDFESVENPEFDLDLIALEAHRRNVTVNVSRKLFEKFVREMERRNCSIENVKI